MWRKSYLTTTHCLVPHPYQFFRGEWLVGCTEISSHPLFFRVCAPGMSRFLNVRFCLKIACTMWGLFCCLNVTNQNRSTFRSDCCLQRVTFYAHPRNGLFRLVHVKFTSPKGNMTNDVLYGVVCWTEEQNEGRLTTNYAIAGPAARASQHLIVHLRVGASSKAKQISSINAMISLWHAITLFHETNVNSAVIAQKPEENALQSRGRTLRWMDSQRRELLIFIVFTFFPFISNVLTGKNIN